MISSLGWMVLAFDEFQRGLLALCFCFILLLLFFVRYFVASILYKTLVVYWAFYQIRVNEILICFKKTSTRYDICVGL